MRLKLPTNKYIVTYSFKLIPKGGINNGCLPKVTSTDKVTNKAVKSFCIILTLIIR